MTEQNSATPPDIHHVILNFHHACPEASEIFVRAHEEARTDTLGAMYANRTLSASYASSLTAKWNILCLKEFEKMKRQKKPLRLDETYAEMISVLQSKGFHVSFLYRHPVNFALMVTEHVSNEEDAAPIWQILDQGDIHSTHGINNRQDVFRSVVNGNGTGKILSIVGSEANAKASKDVGLITWGYVGEQGERLAWQARDPSIQARAERAKKYALREKLSALGVAPIYEQLEAVKKDLEVLPRPEKRNGKPHPSSLALT